MHSSDRAARTLNLMGGEVAERRWYISRYLFSICICVFHLFVYALLFNVCTCIYIFGLLISPRFCIANVERFLLGDYLWNAMKKIHNHNKFFLMKNMRVFLMLTLVEQVVQVILNTLTPPTWWSGWWSRWWWQLLMMMMSVLVFNLCKQYFTFCR